MEVECRFPGAQLLPRHGDWDVLVKVDLISHGQQCEQGTHSSRLHSELSP